MAWSVLALKPRLQEHIPGQRCHCAVYVNPVHPDGRWEEWGLDLTCINKTEAMGLTKRLNGQEHPLFLKRNGVGVVQFGFCGSTKSSKSTKRQEPGCRNSEAHSWERMHFSPGKQNRCLQARCTLPFLGR